MRHSLPILAASLLVLAQCSTSIDTPQQAMADADAQLRVLGASLDEAIAASPEGERGPHVSPRAIRDGELFIVPSRDWTSGFFAGTLWLMYEHTGDPYWLEQARMRNAGIEREKSNGTTHDMGFKIYGSFGHGYRLTGDPAYRDIIIEAANTVITRFRPTVGAIRSWDHNSDKWDYPVIIDNMMNLEHLFRATQLTGDSTYYQIAVTHANTTIANHFRADNSSYHVVSYDTTTGEVQKKNTHQGYAHESAWARGQAWGLYGYTMTYRFTKDPAHLEQAEKIAAFVLNHPNLPEDMVPYWDFDAPGIPDEPRDVSAATIIASALYELSTTGVEKAADYRTAADRMLDHVIRDYRNAPGTAYGFLLDHATGHLPADHEIDTPIIYADYYFIEALMRRMALEKGA